MGLLKGAWPFEHALSVYTCRCFVLRELGHAHSADQRAVLPQFQGLPELHAVKHLGADDTVDLCACRWVVVCVWWRFMRGGGCG